MLEFGLKFLISYLLGSVSGSLVIGRLAGGVDIRQLGSGNAGGTNALRTQGPLFALGVVLIDIGKGALATGIVARLALPGVAAAPVPGREWLAVGCAAAAIIGHIFPFWHGFRGGKGGATVVGAVAVLSPPALLLVLAIWVLIVTTTGYVGLATMSAAVSLPALFALFVDRAELPGHVVFGVGIAALIVWAHRANIQRMRAGTENRQRNLMLLRRRGAAER